MNNQYFQVNVTMATPACNEQCPNLKIDIEDLKYVKDNVDNLHRLRQIRCVNDTYCQNLYRAFEKKRDRDGSDHKPEPLTKDFWFDETLGMG